MTRLRAILFDLDGTLVDTNELHVEAWDRAFRAHGHEFTRERIHGQIGKGGDNLLPSLLPDASEEELEAIDERHGEIYKEELMPTARPFPRATDLLGRARDGGLKVVLASSAGGEEIDHYEELLGKHLISFTTGKDDVESSKPCPDIFEAALEKGGLKPEEAIVVGDTPYDVLAAKRAGLECIALLSGGFSDEELRAAGAVAIYRDAADLLDNWDELPL
ncbi:HAD family hydrolase [Sphingosinicella sp. YJ22]|uniref:HAD family hydrolase n=1 Tax=Sphingosinicella sp. YJ22 TaxID=1104780 RepID=UPI00140A4E0A|nr:HAD family hydrolase [Sphingosinicella sp. YJ22]